MAVSHSGTSLRQLHWLDDFFSLGAEATEEDRAMESCSFSAYYFRTPANLYAEQYDWENEFGNGLNGTPAGLTPSQPVELWQSFEGNLAILAGTETDRCAELSDGYSVEMFDNIRLVGIVTFNYVHCLESYDWWDEGLRLLTTIAINHPADTDLGNNLPMAGPVEFMLTQTQRPVLMLESMTGAA